VKAKQGGSEGGTTYIALLRGVNVGGKKQIAMSDLRDLCTELGFADARSLLQSGNLVFRSDARTAASLERVVEAEVGIGRSRLTHTLIEKKLGTRGTGRNWNTVLKLAALAKS
jgi:uncharacterized protein (DUF1697 family)